jgi:fructose-1,6-bisphosphatase/inositol monophosphatase family enzyme
VTAAPPDHLTELAADQAFATGIAERAGELLVDRIERLEHIDYKSAKDVVTEADHLSEELIIDAIRAAYPGDGIIAEESGDHASGSGDAPTAGVGRAWVIDPLDGTINYANGIPFFCVSIALLEAGQPVVGVVHDPVRGETFAASAEGRAMLDGLPIEASQKDRLSDFVVSVSLAGSPVARARNVREAIRVSRSMGSAALALAYVANGRFDAFVQQGGLSSWDIAAAGLIAQRAGATVTDLGGGPWFEAARKPRSIGVLAAPPGQHAELLGLLTRRS